MAAEGMPDDTVFRREDLDGRVARAAGCEAAVGGEEGDAFDVGLVQREKVGEACRNSQGMVVLQ